MVALINVRTVATYEEVELDVVDHHVARIRVTDRLWAEGGITCGFRAFFGQVRRGNRYGHRLQVAVIVLRRDKHQFLSRICLSTHI
jgi:hypothetical protein